MSTKTRYDFLSSRHAGRFAILIAATTAVTSPVAFAVQWNQTGAGPYSWGLAANWNGSVPNSTTVEATLSQNLTADQTILADGQSAGIVDIGDLGSQHIQTLQGTFNIATHSFIGLDLGAFDGSASINLNGSNSSASSSVISAPLTIAQNAALSFTSATTIHGAQLNTLTLSGGLSGTTFSMTVDNANVILASPSNAISTTVNSPGTLQVNDAGDLTGNVTVGGNLNLNGSFQTFAALNVLPSGVVNAGSSNIMVGQFNSSMTFSGTFESANNGDISILSGSDISLLGTVTNLGNMATAQNAVVNFHVGSGVGGDFVTLAGSGNLIPSSLNTLIAGASGKATETLVNSSNILGSVIVTSLNLVNNGGISAEGTIKLQQIAITNTGVLNAIEPGSTLSIIQCSINNSGGFIRGQAGGVVTLLGNTTIAGGQLATSVDQSSQTPGQIKIDTHTIAGTVIFDGLTHGAINSNASLFINSLSTAQFTGSITNNASLALDTSANALISGAFTGVGNVTIGASATVTLAPTAAPVLQTSALTLAGSSGAWTGGLNLNYGKLILESDSPLTLATVNDQVAYGLTHPDGIYSSLLTNHIRQTIVVVDNAAAGFSTFGGVPISANSTLLMQTFFGDANLDGKVDLTDLSTILNHFGVATPNWTSGNFDHAPTIDLTDLSAVLNNFGLSNPIPSNSQLPIINDQLPTPTPEPASLFFSTLLLPLLLRRRNHQPTVAVVRHLCD